MTNSKDILLKPEATGAEQSKYLIHSPLEIAAILNGLRSSGRLVTAYFGAEDFILTSVVAVDSGRGTVYMDHGGSSAASKRALQAKEVTFVALHERIKIQFAASALSPARIEGRDVFAMALPQSLLRLQRREYFRIATPVARPLLCIVAAQAIPGRDQFEAVIVDISCGGVALVDSGAPHDFEIGARLPGCRIPLPEIGEVVTDIDVRSGIEITLRNGRIQRQAGCEFVGMRERERNLIQRYISKLERERTARGATR